MLILALCLLSVPSATRTPITISCPSDFEYEVNPDVSLIPVRWRTPIAINTDAAVVTSVECYPGSGEKLGVGIMPVSCVARSYKGGEENVEDTCSFSVTVINIG